MRRQVMGPTLMTESTAGVVGVAEVFISSFYRKMKDSRLAQVVDPVDIEEILGQKGRSSALLDSSASPRRLQDFPTDDVHVSVLNRESNTLEPPVPTDLNWAKLDQVYLVILSVEFPKMIIDLAVDNRVYFNFCMKDDKVGFEGDGHNRPLLLGPIDVGPS